MVISPIPDLVSDFAIRGAARPIADATIVGKCSVHVPLTNCEATLSARRPGLPDLLRKVDFWFVDFHFGHYTATVMSDPAQPEKMTTDLALDKLWNRTVTLLLLGPFSVWIGYSIIKFMSRGLRARRAVVRALSNQILLPTILRLDSWKHGAWSVTSLPPTGNGKSCEWETKGTPIFTDQTGNFVLGVTTGDGAECMPLDTKLSWIDLTARERAALFEKLGPERLRARTTALDRLARGAPWLMAVSLVFAAAAGIAVWFESQQALSQPDSMEVIVAAVCAGIALPLFPLAILGYIKRRVG
jgi:hypothetical protein